MNHRYIRIVDEFFFSSGMMTGLNFQRVYYYWYLPLEPFHCDSEGSHQ